MVTCVHVLVPLFKAWQEETSVLGSVQGLVTRSLHGGYTEVGDVPLFCVEFCTFSLDHSKHILCMQIKIRKRVCGKTGLEKRLRRGAEQSGKEKKIEAGVKEEDSRLMVGPPLTPALSQNKRPSLLTP